MKNSEFIYELKSSNIEYAHAKDGVTTANFCTMKVPSLNHLSKIAPMRQFFTQAVMHIQSTVQDSDASDAADTDKKDVKLTGDAVISILEGSNVDMAKVHTYFEAILLSPLCLLDGETELTKHLHGQLSIEDAYGLLGEYYVNFIVASL